MNKQDCFYVWNSWTEMQYYKNGAFHVVMEADQEYLKDHRKQKVLDGISCLFNCNVGYGNQKIVKAITDQLSYLSCSTSFRLSSEVSIQLAKKLCTLTDDHYSHAFFVNSGSEATETALKMAMQYYWNQGIKKSKFICFEGAYHGATLGALSVCGLDADKEPFSLVTDNTIVCDVYKEDDSINVTHNVEHYLSVLEEKILSSNPDEIAGVIIEPIQLCHNVNILPAAYLKGIHRLCKAYNILFIVDEIATGFGRTGSMFAMDEVGVYPDMILLAKGITSGYIPMGAVLTTDQIFNEFLHIDQVEKDKLFRHGSTTSGNPAACAAALATIDVIESEQLCKNSKVMGKYLLNKLKSFEAYPFISKVRGKGLFTAIIFDDAFMMQNTDLEKIVYLVRDIAYKKGVVLFPTYDVGNAILLAPMLTVDEVKIDHIITQMTKTFAKMEKYFSVVTT